MPAIESVTVFCGSAPGASPAYVDAVREFAGRLARAGIRAVYGGGGSGLMGAFAESALAAGGEVIGVIPGFLHEREVAHRGVTDLRVVDSMHERKQLMFDLSDAACALPGGLGTLDEVIELITWRQLGLHGRTTVILNTDGYWDGLRALTERIVGDDFAKPDVHAFFDYVATPEQAVAALSRARPPSRREDGSRL